MNKIDKDIEAIKFLMEKEMDDNDSNKYIYHYTSIEGMLGIVGNNCLWLSNIYFLNDKSEIEHSLNMLRKHIEKKCTKHIKEYLAKFLDEEYVMQDFGMHVASFCEAKELLGQWYVYAKSGNGCQIKFNKKGMQSLEFEDDSKKRNKVKVLPVIYDNKKKLEIIDKFIKLVETVYNYINRESRMPLERLDLACHVFFLKAICFFKDACFSGEKEYRMLAFLDGKDSNVKYRLHNNYLVPYVCAKRIIKNNTQPLPIRGITVGPVTDEKLAVRSIQMFMESKGYKFKVQRSGIPIR